MQKIKEKQKKERQECNYQCWGNKWCEAKQAIRGEVISKIMEELKKIKGGYIYSGACSVQVCFQLKAGGELRFSVVDDDCKNEYNPIHPCFNIDLYSGNIAGCVTGYYKLTG